jgi:predicted dienelactone hydrolase
MDWVRVIIALWLFCAAHALRVAASEAAGPFAVDTLRLEWRDERRQREVPVKIYFPKDTTNACPIIVFSHGLGGTRDGYEFLGRHWASHGFVSAHVQHRGSDDAVWRGKARTMESMRSATTDPEAVRNRPLDISFAIDELLTMNAGPGALGGKLDTNRIGVAGHSFGAWTTLAIAGQQVGGRSFADPRVTAVIAMSAPVPKSASAATYFGIGIPVMHMTGTMDNSPIGDTPAKDRRVPFDLIANAPQWLIIFNGGDHMVFSGRTPLPGPKRDDARRHELIRTSTTAFWNAYLRGDSSAAAWLTNGELKSSLGTNATLEIKTKQ